MKTTFASVFALCCVLPAAGCASGAPPITAGGTNAVPFVASRQNTAASSVPSGDYIKHVIVIVQENRTFDNLFARFPGADGATEGRTHTGAMVPLRKADLFSDAPVSNSHASFLIDYDGGKMDGFDTLPYEGNPYFVYQYVDPAQIRSYWTLAKRYVLADHFFSTQSSGSFTAHQDLIRGDSSINDTESLIDFPTGSPWGCDAPSGTVTSLITPAEYLADQGPYPCLTYRTLRDLLDAKHVTWKYYADQTGSGDSLGADYWNAFDAIKAVREGPEWKTNVSMPNTNIFNDIASKRLPRVSWIVPAFPDSDHPGDFYGQDYDHGPAWVAQVVNAIGHSPYWSNCAILIMWDDWGGFYDHVPPPQYNDQSLGNRVPLIVVSPYAKTSYVMHGRYETASLVRFIEDNWNLGRLGTGDVRAADIVDAFNFNRTPRPFVTVRR
jgi:phospholipase C